MNNLINFLTAGILAAAPLLFGVLGEILTEKSGNLNLGVEGMMFMGGIGGLMGAYFYERAVGGPSAMVAVLIAILCAMLFAGFGALLYSIITITFRANQNVTGLAPSILGVAFCNLSGDSVACTYPSRVLSVGNPSQWSLHSATLPQCLVYITYTGKLPFSHTFLVYWSSFMRPPTSLFPRGIA